MITKNYQRTDLAEECRARSALDNSSSSGIDFSEERLGSITVSKLFILDENAESRLGKPRGCYITLGFGNVLVMDSEERETLSSLIADSILSLSRSICPKLKKVMVAGLGNRRLTCDSLGPSCADGITVTRELALNDTDLFQKLGHLETSAISPGVSAETGIESADVIASAVKITSPDLVILIDALAAASPERLLKTVQLCNTGIEPGSGVGNKRAPLSSATLGVPVIALGVPTMTDSSALVFDVLKRSGINEKDISPELLSILENGRDFFVSPRDCDAVLGELSPIISRAIDILCSVSS